MSKQIFFSNYWGPTPSDGLSTAKIGLFSRLSGKPLKADGKVQNSKFGGVEVNLHDFRFVDFPESDFRAKVVVEAINCRQSGVEAIADERREHWEKHGRTIPHDVEFNENGELAKAAAFLCAHDVEAVVKPTNGGINAFCPDGWDFSDWQKMCSKPYRERLIIAGSLIAAELDRLNALEEMREG